MLFFFICAFYVLPQLFCSTNDHSVIDSITPDVYILDANGNQKRSEHVALTYNSHVTLICRTPSTNQEIFWHYSVFDSNDFTPVVPTNYLSVDRTKRGEVALQLKQVQFSMAGTYQCSTSVASRLTNVHVYGITNAIGGSVNLIPKREVVGQSQYQTYVFDPTSSPSVACQFRVGRYGIKYVSVRWRGGKFATHPNLYDVAYSSDELHGYIWSNLTIKHPTFDRALYGKYTCQFNIISGSMESAEVEITVPPLIRRSDQVIGPYSGKRFSYTCEVMAYPDIVGAVAWSREGKPIQINSKGNVLVPAGEWASRITFETDQHRHDRIVFDPVQPEDRAVYSCFLRSPLGNATGAFYLRVKDRWSIVWPLLGIGLEVTVLFVIILLYEIKQRAKKKAEKELDDDALVTATRSLYGRDASGDEMSLRQRPVPT